MQAAAAAAIAGSFIGRFHAILPGTTATTTTTTMRVVKGLEL